jgi:hypothetical protein
LSQYFEDHLIFGASFSSSSKNYELQKLHRSDFDDWDDGHNLVFTFPEGYRLIGDLVELERSGGIFQEEIHDQIRVLLRIHSVVEDQANHEIKDVAVRSEGIVTSQTNKQTNKQRASE